MTECTFNHMTDEQRKLLVEDAADIFARFIQDNHHATLNPELAQEMGRLCVEAGLRTLEMVVDNAFKINRLTATITLSGLAGDAK